MEMITDHELEQMISDLVGKKCQAFSFGEGIITKLNAEVLDITLSELFLFSLSIAFKNGTKKKGGPSIQINEPFQYTKESNDQFLRYKFHRFDKLLLLIGYVKEDE